MGDTIGHGHRLGDAGQDIAFRRAEGFDHHGYATVGGERGDAVKKIREVLGPTDPSKAPPGSIRREFGQNIMVNAAHASDSEENATRELAIVNVGGNNLRTVVEAAYGKV